MKRMMILLLASVILGFGAEEQTVTKAGTQASIKGSSAYFTGNVRVDPLFPVTEASPFSGAYVTFEPGARSFWHVHPSGQHLVVTSGMGWTQEVGKQKVEVKEGDVIWCPPGVKHWHGATATSSMTHMALTGTLNGKNVEWLEAVSDEQYKH